MGNTIATYSGGRFDFRDVLSNEIDYVDMVQALSHIPRFGGHTKFFWSVAQHSVLVANILFNGPDRKHAYAGLLHDAHEAFVLDATTPMKSVLPDYTALEHRVQAVVLRAFGLDISDVSTPEVRRADLVALGAERYMLFPSKVYTEHWSCFDEFGLTQQHWSGYQHLIKEQSFEEARADFHKTAAYLGSLR